jgi:hypothetical protein
MRPYVAGATALNRDGPGFSRDIDVFNDRVGSVGAEADTDMTLLSNDGFECDRGGASRAWMSRWRNELEHDGQRRGHWPSLAEISSVIISSDLRRARP